MAGWPLNIPEKNKYEYVCSLPLAYCREIWSEQLESTFQYVGESEGGTAVVLAVGSDE
jgi:hypothetical protein